MKHLITAVIILSSITARTSQDFECKHIYESKILRMEKHATLRTAGHYAGTVVIGLAGGIAIATTLLPLLPLGVAIYGTMFGFGPGMAAYVGLSAFDREDGIRHSFNAQILMNTSYAELVAELEKSRELILKKSLEEFYNRVTHPEFLDKLVRETNRERLAQNLPALSPSQTIEFHRAKITSHIMDQPIVVDNEISTSLAFAKKRGKVAPDLNYDGWRQILINNQRQFCPNGKAITLRKATKNILSDFSAIQP